MHSFFNDPALFTVAVTVILMTGAIGFAIGAMFNGRPRRPLSVIFYRRVLAIANTIEKAKMSADMEMLKGCLRRIDNDSDFSHPDAAVVKQMLLADIAEAKSVINLFTSEESLLL